MADQKTSPITAVGGLLLAGLGGWYYFGGGLEQETARRMDDIYKQVSADAVAQYGIASRNGTPMDRCAQAGMVAAAFLQEKNEAQYKRWKQTEAKDCEAAGVPR